jgi:hypothetical protein
LRVHVLLLWLLQVDVTSPLPVQSAVGRKASSGKVTLFAEAGGQDNL